MAIPQGQDGSQDKVMNVRGGEKTDIACAKKFKA